MSNTTFNNCPEVIALQNVEYFHGFIPREDVCFALTQKGEFLVRVSEPADEYSPHKVDVILNYCAGNLSENKEDAADAMIRNIVLSRDRIRFTYFLEFQHKFKSVQDFVNFYKLHDMRVANVEPFRLVTPVRRKDWELHNDELIIGDKLGNGAFGEVLRGNLGDLEVAIKRAKLPDRYESDMAKEKRDEMMNEARIMRFIVHPNIVRTHGISVLQQPVLIVLELVDGGSLDTYLRKNKGKIGVHDKELIILDAATGIEFLHQLGCIHRDIAARNCLVKKTPYRPMIKISDFGLSKISDVFKVEGGCAKNMAIKWAAPELFFKLEFSSRTDVWAFGIMVCEIFLDSNDPWGSKGNKEVVNTLKSRRLFDYSFLDRLDGGMYKLLKEVFNFDEKKRWNMKQVTDRLEILTKTMRRTLTEENVKSFKAVNAVKKCYKLTPGLYDVITKVETKSVGLHDKKKRSRNEAEESTAKTKTARTFKSVDTKKKRKKKSRDD